MPAQIEGHAYATECRQLARSRNVLVLIATPAVHEQHSGHERPGRDQRAEDVFIFDPNVDGLIACCHGRSVHAYLVSGSQCGPLPEKYTAAFGGNTGAVP